VSETIAERWQVVRARVESACVRAGRDPKEVTIVAVSKTHDAEAVRAAVAAGVTDLGENYAQEMADKQQACADLAVRWHFIGRLQSNKAKLVAGKVALVHAVDSTSLAIELGKRAGAGVVQPILLAINLAGEATKGGITEAQVYEVARAIRDVDGVRLDGFMTMPPPSEDPEASRPYFERLRTLRDELPWALDRDFPVLSMGMSGDYEVAIACGATHVRIGTAIFGRRPAH
jgi:pyridoxal phosphate enzyme (YggS family)